MNEQSFCLDSCCDHSAGAPGHVGFPRTCRGRATIGTAAHAAGDPNQGSVTPITVAGDHAGPQIRVGDFADATAITPDGKTLFVVNGESSSVTPISIATNRALPAITVGKSPGPAIAITPNGTSSSVTPIRTSTNRALASIKVGFNPGPIAITPDGETAYVVNKNSAPESIPSTVTPIQTDTNHALKAIRVGDDPVAIAITSDGKTAYVVNAPFPGPFNPFPPRLRDPYPDGHQPRAQTHFVGNSPTSLAITPDGTTVYVSNLLATMAATAVP